jgi:hypothetical protein
MTTVHLDPNQVPAHLKAGYSGKHLKARVCERVTVPMTAGLWDGGSRDTYRVVRLSDGAEISPVDESAAPWDRSRSAREIALEPGFCVVEHSIFRGKDLGLTFHMHPQDATRMLPAPVELTELERMVLEATRSLKASYGGRDRYQMATDNLRYSDKPSRTQWDEAKAALIGRGYLNKAGAITTAGKNAVAR